MVARARCCLPGGGATMREGGGSGQLTAYCCAERDESSAVSVCRVRGAPTLATRGAFSCLLVQVC